MPFILKKGGLYMLSLSSQHRGSSYLYSRSGLLPEETFTNRITLLKHETYVIFLGDDKRHEENKVIYKEVTGWANAIYNESIGWIQLGWLVDLV